MRSRGKGMLIAAVALIAVGVLGMIGAGIAASLAGGGGAGSSGGRRGGSSGGRYGNFSSNGERIFYTGVGHDGPIRNEWRPSRGGGGMMGRRGGRSEVRMGCVNCHGEDGRGGYLMMADVDAADIRYKTLTSEHSEDGTTTPGWTDDDIAKAVRDGVEPGGEELDPGMPRWDMDDTDMKDTIAYLKELD